MPIAITSVTPVNGALPALLYDAAGSPLVLRDRALALGAQGGLPQIMLEGGVGRAARGDVTAGQSIARFAQMFLDMVDGATVNTQIWTQSTTTQTIVQAMRSCVLNSGASIAASTFAIHTSLRQVTKTPGSVLHFDARVRLNWQTANAVLECGFGNPAGATAAVPTGAFLRVSATGNVTAVLAYSSGETSSGVLCTIGSGAGQLNPASYYNVDIFLLDDAVRVVVQRSDDTLGGQAGELPVVDYTLRFPVSAVAEFSAISSPIFFRSYVNASGTATASTLTYSGVGVVQHDADMVKPWAEQLAGSSRGLIIHPATGVQLANWPNSAAPASATLSNTAAGYTALGGQWQFAAVAGAETDYALFAFVVPTGRTLYVKAIRIEAWNTVVAVATTGTLLQWGVGRAAAATLASSSFRQAIGMQSFLVGAAVGAGAPPLAYTWESAFVVDSGQTFHVILKMPIATATATEIFRGTCVVDGYLE